MFRFLDLQLDDPFSRRIKLRRVSQAAVIDSILISKINAY